MYVSEGYMFTQCVYIYMTLCVVCRQALPLFVNGGALDSIAMPASGWDVNNEEHGQRLILCMVDTLYVHA